MDNEIYQAPKADLLDEKNRPTHQFYVVSKRKLIILFFATLGLYSIYWFYVNWRNHRDYSDVKVIAWARAIFYIFFTHSLFEIINKAAKEKMPDFSWASQLHATLFILLAILGNGADRLAAKEIGSPITDLIAIALMPFLVYFLCKAQDAINLSQDDPRGDTNKKLTIYNYMWILLGAVIWLAILAALLIMFGLVTI